MTLNTPPRIWLTYAWADDKEGDFSYLVHELRDVGVEAKYDKIVLIPGRDLWEQIGDRISFGELNGWGYLVTQYSLESESCREELSYALARALKTKGRSFPLIGLLHGVRFDDLPPALRVRLCVSLADPNWKEQVLAGLEGRHPYIAPERQSEQIWSVHMNYQGNPKLKAIEVRPRFGEIAYWRFVLPKDFEVKQWGHGPAGGGSISGIQTEVVDGGVSLAAGEDVVWFGAGNKLTPGTSAYIVFEGALPPFVGFGRAVEPFGPPGEVEEFRPA